MVPSMTGENKRTCCLDCTTTKHWMTTKQTRINRHFMSTQQHKSCRVTKHETQNAIVYAQHYIKPFN